MNETQTELNPSTYLFETPRRCYGLVFFIVQLPKAALIFFFLR